MGKLRKNMSKVKLTKEEVDKMMKVKGKVSSSILKSFYHFILERKGQEGLKEVEKRLKELDIDIDFKKLSSFGWYPYPVAIIVALIFLEIFDWDESKAFDIGYDVATQSFIVKLLMNYLSLEQILKEVQKSWKRHYDFGEMKCTEYNKEKKYAILRYLNFSKVHPIENDINRGYLKKLAELAIKSKDIQVEQTKSLFNDDSYHEFKISWS